MNDETPEYIRISIMAVGGPDCDAGREMERLLIEAAGKEEAKPKDAPRPPELPPPAQEDTGTLMPATLEGMFDEIFKKR